MIIINADDWGRSPNDTDAALFCYQKGRITSVSAMVFMEDSIRGSHIAKDASIDVGLHLNLTQRFTGKGVNSLLLKYHRRIVNYLTFNKYAFLFYNPILRNQFNYVYQAQLEEFIKLYGKPPSHINGHHHMHLCANMLFDKVIPKNERVRRNLSFWKGEKSFLNIIYRRMIDRWLSKRYILVDYLFSLKQLVCNNRLADVFELSKGATVEIMTHPANPKEFAYLMSDEFFEMFQKIKKSTYSSI